MMLRRALLRWQLIAIPVLPLWLLIGWGIFGAGAAGFFLLFLGAGVLFVFLGVLAGLTRLRPGVREERAVGWWDAVATVAFHLAVIGLGCFGPTGVAFGVATVLFGLATFWLTVWELLGEWRQRMSGAAAQASVRPDTAPGQRQAHGYRPPPDDGDVIIVHETGR
ncbi:MFS transporter permease [Humibacter ginsenosidimutans]|uniref:MFS transporter permease n=1 Tax=Humibacter ginsenosidimutans TaxID=2599293 RepID=A0A5B8M3C5_9MICO|nr:MFS transporter permease [Humibacter ginsenosidimutans]QDZ14090.1 MFS transporter permease [Humibacter ginsenosidimutans]